MFCRSIRGSCLFAALLVCAAIASAQTVVGPNDRSYQERPRASFDYSPFGNDWRVLGNDIFLGGAKALFGLSPAGLLKRQLVLWPDEAADASSSGSFSIPNRRPNDTLFSFVSPSNFGMRAASRPQLMTDGTRASPNAPTAASNIFVWNNTGTSFNAPSSWTNTGDLSNGTPTFNDIASFALPKVNDPVVAVGTIPVLGLSFETGGTGYTISGASPLAFIGVGASGISGSNITGTNTITAGLLLNFDQSITQAAGGTLNITGPVRMGGGVGTTVLTIGSTSGNGTINFSPSTAEIGNTIELVTNVNATLPSIVSETAGAGLIKSGNATLTLTAGAAPSFDGLTTVNAGTLQITNPSGSATGTGAVVVNNSGTLSGNGFIDAGENTITIHGTLTPGGAGADTIHLASSAGAGALTLSSSSTLVFDITSTAVKDLVALTATGVSLGGGALALNLPNTGPTGIDYTQTYTIFSGVSGLTGSFGSVTGYDTADYLAQFALNGANYDLTFVPIPEPSTWIGGALALAAIVFTSHQKLRARRRLGFYADTRQFSESLCADVLKCYYRS